MDLRLVFAQILFLFETLIAFLALEGLFKFLKEALPALFWRINDGILLISVNHDTHNRTFSFIYFE